MDPPAWGQVLSIAYTSPALRNTASCKPPISTYLPRPSSSSESSQSEVQDMRTTARLRVPSATPTALLVHVLVSVGVALLRLGVALVGGRVLLCPRVVVGL